MLGLNNAWATESKLTVGGGLVLLSDSSTLYSILFSSCSRSIARSRRSFMIARFTRVFRRRAASLFASTSLMRRFNSIHFLWYASSTDGGRLLFCVPWIEMLGLPKDTY